ncbi:MAG TPA: hypothetical protein VLF40_04170 [Candidatus Saccharimonadales bacterium]|nr:hypothetical protein [Candidatus Saccharimonadales bacterium]
MVFRTMPFLHRPKTFTAWLGLGLMGAVLMLLPGISVQAIQYGSGTYGACGFGSCSLTIGSSGTVALNVTPTANGSCTIQKDSVSVFTSNSSGFTLTLADTSTNTALLNGAASISATTGTQASPSALAVNRWGYRVDGVGGFGTGPTSAQSNVSLGSTTFAGVPASNATASTLASTSSAANPAVITSVWYGVCANTSVTSGTYTSQVTYTAVTN